MARINKDSSSNERSTYKIEDKRTRKSGYGLFYSTIQVRISKELREEFEAICKKRQENASAILRRLIMDYIERNK